MKRRLFNIMTALSLLLCMAVLALWVRGASEWVEVSTRRGTFLQIYSSQGIGFVRIGRWPAAPRVAYVAVGPTAHRDIVIYGPTGAGGAKVESREVLGLTFLRGTVCVFVDDGGSVLRGPPFPSGLFDRYPLSPPLPFWMVDVPYWAALLFFGCLPVWLLSHAAVRTLLGRSRRRRRLCPTCGYDLRATPERCPECGAVPHTPARCPECGIVPGVRT